MNNITNEELSMLEACQSAEDWRKACDKIKGAREQCYPDDWWNKVKLTGMMDRILARWGQDSEIVGATFQNTAELIKHLGKREKKTHD